MAFLQYLHRQVLGNIAVRQERTGGLAETEGIALEHGGAVALALVVLRFLLVDVEQLNCGEALNSKTPAQRLVLIRIDGGNIHHALQDPGQALVFWFQILQGQSVGGCRGMGCVFKRLQA